MNKEIYHALSDPLYQNPYTDTDEIRSRTLADGRELSYRYVHGGFRGTAVKYVFCFPPREAFKGRFFQYLSPFPGPDEELASLSKSGADDTIGFALLNGAYFVESNMGVDAMFAPGGDDTVRWKSSAAAAEYSRSLAMEYYACGRPVGIVFGGSGGGYKTMAGIDLTVNGRKCACVKAGEKFVLRAEAILPENAGEITGIGFDLRDRRDFPDKVEGLFPIQGSLLPLGKDGVKGACAETVGCFEKPGTYFVSARVSSQRSGDRNEIFTQVLNLDRVRVNVE